MGSTSNNGRESAFTYGRFSTRLAPDGTSMVNAGTTVLGEQVWFSGNADEAKADMEPIFNLHQDHRFGLKSAIFERFGR
jgi:hypothetical protein